MCTYTQALCVLFVFFLCVADGSHFRDPRVVVCQGQTTTISCTAGHAIHVSVAIYGRTDRTTCYNGEHDAHCLLDGTDAARELCHGKTNCSISATAALFTSACEGSVNPYLEVFYRCEVVRPKTKDEVYREIHQQVGRYYQCQHVEVDDWKLRFKMGSKISPVTCGLKCLASGGSGHHCVNTVTGTCVCGDHKVEFVDPPRDGCNKTCLGTQYPCGGADGLFSCYYYMQQDFTALNEDTETETLEDEDLKGAPKGPGKGHPAPVPRPPPGRPPIIPPRGAPPPPPPRVIPPPPPAPPGAPLPPAPKGAPPGVFSDCSLAGAAEAPGDWFCMASGDPHWSTPHWKRDYMFSGRHLVVGLTQFGVTVELWSDYRACNGIATCFTQFYVIITDEKGKTEVNFNANAKGTPNIAGRALATPAANFHHTCISGQPGLWKVVFGKAVITMNFHPHGQFGSIGAFKIRMVGAPKGAVPAGMLGVCGQGPPCTPQLCPPPACDLNMIKGCCDPIAPCATAALRACQVDTCANRGACLPEHYMKQFIDPGVKCVCQNVKCTNSDCAMCDCNPQTGKCDKCTFSVNTKNCLMANGVAAKCDGKGTCGPPPPPVDCVVETKCTPCSKTCQDAQAVQTCTGVVKVAAQNGGKACPPIAQTAQPCTGVPPCAPECTPTVGHTCNGKVVGGVKCPLACPPAANGLKFEMTPGECKSVGTTATWTPGVCTPICDVPQPADLAAKVANAVGVEAPCNGPLKPGQTCKMTCKGGFKPNGVIECKNTGPQLPMCVPEVKDCPGLGELAGGNWAKPCDTGPVKDGQQCQPQCKPGNNLKGSGPLVCKNGVFDPTPSMIACLPEDVCPLPPQNPIPNGGRWLAIPMPAKEGAKAAFECANGFEKSAEPAEAVCTKGQWKYNGVPRCNPKMCVNAPPQPANGVIAQCTVPAADRAVCVVLCNGKLVKSGDVLCDRGTWIPATCNNKDLPPAPQAPQNDPVPPPMTPPVRAPGNGNTPPPPDRAPNGDIRTKDGDRAPDGSLRPAFKAPNGDTRTPSGDRAPNGSIRPSGGRAPDGDQQSPKGDLAPNGDIRTKDGDRAPDGRLRPAFRAPNGDDRTPSGDRAPDGSIRPSGGRSPNGDNRTPRGDQAPNGDWRNPSGDRSPRGDTKTPSGKYQTPNGDTWTPRGYVAPNGKVRPPVKPRPPMKNPVLPPSRLPAAKTPKQAPAKPQPPMKIDSKFLCTKPLPPVDGGKWVDCRAVQVGGACNLICNPGMIPQGAAICDSGNPPDWNKDSVGTAKCIAVDCVMPPMAKDAGKIDNGRFQCMRAKQGEECTPTCEKCFKPDGKMICAPGGNWTGSAKCIPAGCGAKPQLKDIADAQSIDCPDTKNGSKCTVLCKDDFELIGEAVCSTCQWTVPKCVSKVCKDPPVVAGGTAAHCAGTQSGSRCSPTCKNNVAPSPSSALCKEGVWDAKIDCKAPACEFPPQNPKDGKFPATCTQTAAGDSCKPQCDPGFEPVGEVKCEFENKTGTPQSTWKGTSKCAEKDCVHPPPVPLAGSLQVNCTTVNKAGAIVVKSGDACRLLCNDPGATVPKGEVSCKKGLWTTTAVCSKNPCRQLFVPFGTFKEQCLQDNLPHGTKCQAVCTAGREIKNGPAECTGGKWLNVPECVPIVCSEPPAALDHGDWKWTGKLDVGRAIKWGCHVGYKPVDDSANVICTPGKWSYDPQRVKCIPYACATPPATPANGKPYDTACTNVAHQGKCQLVCNDGFSKSGDAVCNEGTWSAPQCVKKDDTDTTKCTKMPENPANGEYDSCKIVLNGGECPLRCKKGFAPKKPTICKDGVMIPSTCEQENCTAPPVDLNGGSFPATCRNAAPGAKCVPTCKPGKKPVGQAACIAGQWDISAAKCAPLECTAKPVMDVKTGTVECGTPPYADGSICKVECNKDRTPSDSTTKCVEGTWTPVKCLPKQCTPATAPGIVRGQVDSSCKLVADCPINCDPGFVLNPDKPSVLECIDGAWPKEGTNKVPECIEKPCATVPTPNPEHGLFPANCSGQVKCAPTCEPPYTPTGQAECFAGKWKLENVLCTAPECPPLKADTIKGAVIEAACIGKAFPNGKDCKVECPGSKKPTQSLKCLRGSWQVAVVKCAAEVCVAPPKVENGVYDAQCHRSDIQPGTNCAVKCNEGFNLRGGPAVCESGKKWNNIPTCTVGDCTERPSPNPLNGKWLWSGPVANGNGVGFICGNGFVPKVLPQARAICDKGKFNVPPDAAACVPELCDKPAEDPRNGKIAATCGQTKHDGVCTVTCDKGFRKTSDAICLRGEWLMPNCTNDREGCVGKPKNKVAHGKIVNCQFTPNGKSCMVLCDGSFKKVSDIACVNKKFVDDKKPLCVPRECPLPPMPNPGHGRFPASCVVPAKDGAKCLPVCEPGYEPVKNATCNRGTWDVSSALCKPQFCDEPSADMKNVANGNVTCNSPRADGKFPAGYQCNVDCNAGFKRMSAMECSRGKWTPVSCNPLPCVDGPVNPLNGRFDACKNTPSGGKCQIQCAKGYSATQSPPVAECKKGKWTNVPTCNTTGCADQPENPARGTFEDGCAGRASGEQCELKCPPNSDKPGNAVCNTGKWDTTQATCGNPDCDPKTITKPVSVNVTCTLNSKGRIPHGGACTYNCPGHAVPVTPIRCESGVIVGKAQCKNLGCQHLLNVDGGSMPADCRTRKAGEKCIIQCDAGRTNQGDKALTCTDGMWEGTPLCKYDNCTTLPPSVPHGFWVGIKGPVTHLDWVKYQCQDGFQKTNKTGGAECRLGKWLIEPKDVKCVPKTCVEAPSAKIANGGYEPQCQNASHGSLCKVMCSKGYLKNSDAICLNGMWSTPACIKEDTAEVCKEPPASPANGKITCTSGTIVLNGDECRVLCDAGYTVRNRYQCKKGTYEAVGGPVECAEEGCKDPPTINPTKGTFNVKECSNKNSGETCPFSCDEGYRPEGEANCERGVWNTDAPRCKPNDCEDDPAVIDNAQGPATCTDKKSGTKCSFTCNDGYQPLGSVRCNQGVWTSATCQPLMCDKPPVIPNGKVSHTCEKTSGYGGVCLVRCEPGYSLDSKVGPNLVCTKGTWSTVPKCVANDCPKHGPMRVSNGEWRCDSSKPGSKCTLECIDRYDPVNGEATCDKSLWVGAAEARCREKPCSDPIQIENGNSNCQPTKDAPLPHGTICSVQCDDGKEKTGDVLCVSGTWSAPKCVEKNDDVVACTTPPADVDNGFFDDCSRLAEGEMCKLNCEPGFKATKPGAKCIKDDNSDKKGRYEDGAVCEQEACTEGPKITLAQKAVADAAWVCPEDLKAGAICQLKCPPKYTPSGVTRCVGGKWHNEEQVHCVPTECKEEDIPSMDNGNFPNCHRALNNDSCILKCDDGYETSPDSKIKCVAGVWVKPFGVACQQKKCIVPPVVLNGLGTADCIGKSNGEACRIVCDQGFAMGSSTIGEVKCQDGSYPDAECSPQECRNPPPNPRNGNWECSGEAPYAAGVSCDLKCENNARPDKTTCKNGKWANVGNCEKKPCTTAPSATAKCSLPVADGSTCLFQCNDKGEGKTKTGDYLCNDGVWSTPTCVIPDSEDCTGPPTRQVKNGGFGGCGDRKNGAECQVLCDHGYTPEGKATCKGRNNWDADTVKCIPQGCTSFPQSIPNAKFTCTPSATNVINHGDTCSYECGDNDTPEGEVTCLHGEWKSNGARCKKHTCPPPPPVKFGSFPTCVGIKQHGEKCELVCSPPFIPSGFAVCVNGEWVKPTCAEPACTTSPYNPRNGDYKCDLPVPSGEACPLECRDGSTKTGDPVCRNGTWAVPAGKRRAPACIPESCKGFPPTVKGGEWDCNEVSSHDDKCELMCPPGTKSSGEAVCHSGKWTNTAQTCVPMPCKYIPSNPPKGSYSPRCANTPSGGVCKLICEPGYIASTAAGEAKCTSGSWRQNPTCVPEGCVNGPSIPNGFTAQPCAKSKDGQTCDVECSRGYKPKDNKKTATCKKNVWEDVPVCEEEQCTAQPAAPRNVKATWTCADSKPGSSCTLNCGEGYTAMPKQGAVCKSGLWDVVGVCYPNNCTDAPPADGDVVLPDNCAGTASGIACDVTCPDGKKKSRNPICELGKWTPGSCITPEEESCNEQPKSPKNGVYRRCLATKDGDGCEVVCNSGFTAEKPQANCRKGTWEDIVEECLPVGCAMPPAENVLGGKWSNLDDCKDKAHGDTCNFECDSPRKPIAQPSAVCVRGQWDLKDVECVMPPCSAEDLSGKVDGGSFPGCKGQIFHGRLCELVCQAPMVAVGDAKCVAGTWQIPHCEAPGCTTPPTPPTNGRYPGSCTQTRQGGVCQLTCGTGTRPTGDSVCRMGRWESTAEGGVPPTCMEIPCSGPPTNTIDNGEWDCPGLNKPGAKCELACLPGYVDSGHATCKAGQWQDTDRECAPRSCTLPPLPPSRGVFATGCENAPHKAMCKLTCDEGLTPSADAVCEFGSWSHPICKQQSCNDLPLVLNGVPSANCLENPESGSCRISCDAGFDIPQGQLSTARCASGQWVYVPSCVSMRCNSPPSPVRNGTFQCTSADHMQRCRLLCDPGYETAADSLCEFGRWTGAPRCKRQQCPDLPEVERGTYDPEVCKANNEDGQTCPIICPKNSEMKTADILCYKGKWIVPECKQKASTDCRGVPEPAPENGEYNKCFRTADGGSCTLMCNPGYKKTGDAICEKKIWKPASCKPVGCRGSPQPVPYGTFEKCSGKKSGSICTLRCNNDRKKRGDAVCMNGKWNLKDAVCDFEPCSERPEIDNGRFAENCTGSIASGESCAVLCDEGYSTAGSAACLNGRWTLPKCEAPGCTNVPDAPVRGAYPSSCANVKDGDQCPLKCNDGYAPTGEAICLGGEWIGDSANSQLPKCVPKGCKSKPSDVDNGIWDCKSGKGTQDQCDLSCDAGYTPVGYARCVGSEWMYSKVTRCDPKPCAGAAPPLPANGERYTSECRDVAHGGVCAVVCKPGFSAAGEAVCEFGSWKLASCSSGTCEDPPAIANGIADTTCKSVDGDNGKCRVRCFDGFTIDGPDSNANCRNGEWSFIPTCRPMGCATAPEVVPHGRWGCTGASSGGVCGLQCEDGYTPTGVAKCSNSKWTEIPLCKGGCSTKLPTVSNGQFKSDCTANEGDTCELICDAPYRKTADSRCVRGEWSEVICTNSNRGACTAPLQQRANGQFDPCTNTPNGGICALRCDSGYEATGPAVCRNGAWQQSVTCQPKKCNGEPQVQNGYFVDSCSGSANGQQCKLTCKAGTGAVRNPVCNNGQWDYTGVSCDIVSCIAMPIVQFGSFSGCKLPLANGHGCPVKCDDGFDPTDVEAECVNGRWRLPSCVPRCPAAPVDPARGAYAAGCDKAKHNQVCLLSCGNGFQKTGDAVCKEGRWVNFNGRTAQPACIPKECPLPIAKIEHGFYQGVCAEAKAGAPHGTVCPTGCEAGFSKSGDATCVNGAWTQVICRQAKAVCEGIACKFDANSTLAQCNQIGCSAVNGKCELMALKAGTWCDDGNAATVKDQCDGKGSCLGLVDPCPTMTCPFPPNQCTSRGVCNPDTATCDFPKLPVGAPCDDEDPTTVNDACNANSTCVGYKKSLQPYVGKTKWGTSCCLIVSVVADGPVSVIELFATAPIDDLSRYALVISGSPLEPEEFASIEVGLPAFTMKTGETFTLVNDRVAFKKYFNNQLPSKSEENLPKLTGKERFRLIFQKNSNSPEILADYFPPTNDSNTYLWREGFAYRTATKGWNLQQDAFKSQGNTTVPLDQFSISGPFRATCKCVGGSNKDAQGRLTCTSAATKTPVTTFGPTNVMPDEEFGADKWSIPSPGKLITYDGQWECSF